jgi:hypothetical protein
MIGIRTEAQPGKILMGTELSRLLLVCAAMLLATAGSSAFAEDISISGVVRTNRDVPIHMIKVTIYRDDRELLHAFTGEDGKYKVAVPKGKPVTVRFDTHWSLTNARDWHPSVVANVEATKDQSVDRILLRVGHGDDFTTFIDALSGYEFGAFWEEADPSKGYAESAVERLGMLKLRPNILIEAQRKLQDHFRERTRGP